MKIFLKNTALFMMTVILAIPLYGCVKSEVPEEEVASENVDTEETNTIIDVKGIGIIDADGSKLAGLVIDYGVEIAGDSVSIDTYELEDYGIIGEVNCELGDNPGIIQKVYVSNVPELNKESQQGQYVIIEVNTDYQLDAVPRYQDSMIFGVRQAVDIMAADGSSIPSMSEFYRNYEEIEIEEDRGGEIVAVKAYDIDSNSYEIPDISSYQLHTIEEGKAFKAYNCFEESTGELVDVELPYAIYVPEDYDDSKTYGLVLHIHDAGFMGTDPMITLTESNAPAVFASDEAKKVAQDQGLDGLIVLCPQIEEAIRTTRDNYTISAGVAATWQLMDEITETYSIDKNRIFASGQSMGAMQVLCMAAQRDNYFAGIWACGSQWGNNYNKEEPYKGESYYPSTDATIWNTDADGNDSDYGSNWYYLISDDNILSTNCTGDSFSTTIWRELKYLYLDIADTEIPYDEFSPFELTVEEQDARLSELLSEANETGIYWQAFDGGNHMLTWVYGRKLFSGYEWLLSQTKESEDSRNKLQALNAKWETEEDENIVAEKNTEDRIFYKDDTETVYFAVAKDGAGTIGYNSSWCSPIGKYEATPGW